MFRYALSTDPVLGIVHAGLPLGTMVVNALGSFVGGFAVNLSLRATAPAPRSLMIGFAGGVTTYSAFSLEAVYLLLHGHLLSALVYTVTSVALYILAAAAGFLVLDIVGRS